MFYRASSKTASILFIIISFILQSIFPDLSAKELYISLDGNAIFPYASLEDAATSIQVAVDSAESGDVLLVDKGTYRLLDTVKIDKALTIRSIQGAALTTVIGSGQNRCFLMEENTVLTGFTITGGKVVGDADTNQAELNGGGVMCLDSTAEVRNCIFYQNTAHSGGAMYLGTAYDCTFNENVALVSGGALYKSNANDCIFNENTSPAGGAMDSGTARNCEFNKNSVSATTFNVNPKGGGLYFGDSIDCQFNGNRAYLGAGQYGGTALRCTFKNNSAVSGGGMYRGDAKECTFEGNSADFDITKDYVDLLTSMERGSGGGMNNGTASDCTFIKNEASFSGGGMFKGVARNCSFIQNSSKMHGGGTSTNSAYSCLFVENTAENAGGGMVNGTANNCTFVRNTAGKSGGGVAGNMLIIGSSTGFYSKEDAHVRNCIFYDNTILTPTSHLQINHYTFIFESARNVYNSKTVKNSCIPDQESEVLVRNGNIAKDPMFEDPDGDYRLRDKSPCRDTGDNESVTSETDLFKNKRILNNTVDMGALEFDISTYPPIILSHFIFELSGRKTQHFSFYYPIIDGPQYRIEYSYDLINWEVASDWVTYSREDIEDKNYIGFWGDDKTIPAREAMGQSRCFYRLRRELVE
jgi:hypothetical protein